MLGRMLKMAWDGNDSKIGLEEIVYRCSQSGELEVQMESLVNKRL